MNSLIKTYPKLLVVFSIFLLHGCGGDAIEFGERIQLAPGLSMTYYANIEELPGKKGDIIEFDVLQKAGNTVFVNTYEMPDYRFRAILGEPSFEADYMSALLKLAEGDSVLIEVDIDAIPLDQQPAQLRDKEGKVEFLIAVRQTWNEKELIANMVERLSNGKPEAWVASPRGVRVFWDEKGDGIKADVGDTISMHVKGLFTNGVPFMSTFDTIPIRFVYGVDPIEPKAWEDVATMVSTGDKVTVISPYEMAFGDRDRNPILKYSTLVFEIDILEIKKPY